MTNAGIKYQGDWDEICEFADYLSEIIDEHIDDKNLDNYNDWKPEKHEDENVLSGKTAKEASINETKIEKKASDTKKQHMNEERDSFDSSNDNRVRRVCKGLGRTMGAKSIESIRKIEIQIYDKIMLRLNPFYFDVENFSINVEKNNGYYILSLNIPDEDIRKDIKKKLKNGL